MTTLSRADLVSIALTYLDALISREGDGVPLSPNVRWVEQGMLIASQAEQVIKNFKRLPRMERVNTRLFVDAKESSVVAFAILKVGTEPTRNDNAIIMQSPRVVHLVERFRITEGLITEIEGVFHPVDNASDFEINWQ